MTGRGDYCSLLPMTAPQDTSYVTPFEAGNGNQTATWAECIAFYERLASDFPGVLRWGEIGTSDTGAPIHAGVVTADGVFDRETLKRQGRPVFFNNNGIHPGEPEGIDTCMALVRDFCTQPTGWRHWATRCSSSSRSTTWTAASTGRTLRASTSSGPSRSASAATAGTWT